MYDPVMVTIDQDTIKFTPEGKIDVLDAIASLGAAQDPPALWQRLLLLNPELAALCQSYPFANQPPSLVADGDGWERIQAALFEFIVEVEA